MSSCRQKQGDHVIFVLLESDLLSLAGDISLSLLKRREISVRSPRYCIELAGQSVPIDGDPLALIGDRRLDQFL